MHVSTGLPACHQRAPCPRLLGAHLPATRACHVSPNLCVNSQLRARQDSGRHARAPKPLLAAALRAAEVSGSGQASSNPATARADAQASSSGRGGTAWDTLAHWLENGGGNLSFVGLKQFKLEGGFEVRGVSARRDFREGDIVLTVPLSCSILDTDCPEPYRGAPWNVRMAVRLLAEVVQQQRGGNSRYAPYLALLPQHQTTPLAFTPFELQQLQYTPAITAAEEYQNVLREAWTSITAERTDTKPDFGYPELLWALTMVMSRTLRMAQLGVRVMLPGIDMLNHGGSALAAGRLALGRPAWSAAAAHSMAAAQSMAAAGSTSGTGGTVQRNGGASDMESASVHFVAGREIQEGSQVWWTYGDRGNDDFLLYHGFVLPGPRLPDGTVSSPPGESYQVFGSILELVAWARCAGNPFATCTTSGLSTASCTTGNMDGSETNMDEGLAVLVEVVSEVVSAAVKAADARCATARVPGTESYVVVSGASAEQQAAWRRWQQRHLGSGPADASSPSSSCATPAAVLAQDIARAIDFSGAERCVSTLQLHRPDWGSHKLNGNAAANSSSTNSTNSNSSSSSRLAAYASSSGTTAASATAATASNQGGYGSPRGQASVGLSVLANGVAGAPLVAALRCLQALNLLEDVPVSELVAYRCSELLSRLPTSAGQDVQLLHALNQPGLYCDEDCVVLCMQSCNPVHPVHGLPGQQDTASVGGASVGGSYFEHHTSSDGSEAAFDHDLGRTRGVDQGALLTVYRMCTDGHCKDVDWAASSGEFDQLDRDDNHGAADRDHHNDGAAARGRGHGHAGQECMRVGHLRMALQYRMSKKTVLHSWLALV